MILLPPLPYLDQLDSPALLVYPTLIEQNIRDALSLVGTKDRLCPHIKTVKCPKIVQLALAQGITTFKCSTIAEAEMLARANASDVLLAYPLTAQRAHRLRQLQLAFPNTHFAGLVDNFPAAQLASNIFADTPLAIYVDLNLGMDRTGVSPQQVNELLGKLITLPGIIISGLHAYDGHIHASDYGTRLRHWKESYQWLLQVHQEATKILERSLTVVAGGSPTFAFYAQRSEVVCSPGTFFLWDAGYGEAYPELPFTTAAVLLTRVVSIVDHQTLCLDLGYKAIASESTLSNRVVFPDVAEYTVVGQYEEHMVVQVPNTANCSVGEAWRAIPQHICPTVNLYEELVPVLPDGTIGKPWRVVARNRKITLQ